MLENPLQTLGEMVTSDEGDLKFDRKLASLIFLSISAQSSEINSLKEKISRLENLVKAKQ